MVRVTSLHIPFRYSDDRYRMCASMYEMVSMCIRGCGCVDVFEIVNACTKLIYSAEGMKHKDKALKIYLFCLEKEEMEDVTGQPGLAFSTDIQARVCICIYVCLCVCE